MPWPPAPRDLCTPGFIIVCFLVGNSYSIFRLFLSCMSIHFFPFIFSFCFNILHHVFVVSTFSSLIFYVPIFSPSKFILSHCVFFILSYTSVSSVFSSVILLPFFLTSHQDKRQFNSLIYEDMYCTVFGRE